ncbi:hypothetical protein [Amycolatopsis sp. NPDC059657]|uniref:hypothetical protein n=1 Tax=Amycolatopsis sp. NPDC059657 TaxID=3346899 RepID=UPI003670C03C
MKCLRISVLAIVVISATSCSNSGTPAPSPETPPPASSTSALPPSPEEIAKQAALAAYDGYWKTSTAAEKDPRAKDWRQDLSQYLVDPELTKHLAEIQNLASVPAHMEGDYGRAPVVSEVSLKDADPRVKITDCLDRTQLHLISDKPGDNRKVLDNPDQPRRYEFRAEVVRYATLDNRWLVQVVQAQLDKPC